MKHRYEEVDKNPALPKKSSQKDLYSSISCATDAAISPSESPKAKENNNSTDAAAYQENIF